jgi:LPPG:FO 2-phospho-L-lactate transferase
VPGDAPVVVLAGGTGGAKLARGMLDVVGAERLVVIANSGDDIEIHGAHVSPDPDLVTFWLADRIDERGWGLRDDTFHVMDGLRELGEEVWFNLGDRDLAIGIRRARALAEGRRQTDIQAEIAAALGVRARVLPMCEEPVRTRIAAHGRTWTLQEFLIRAAGRGPVDDVRFAGARNATPPPEALSAIAQARAVVIGPSNPIISIGPILAVPALRAALEATVAPVVAVSPIVAGKVLKGPTAAFLEWRGVPVSGAGIAAVYAGLIGGLLCDDPVEALPSARVELLMDGAEGRRRLAAQALELADRLAAGSSR